MNLIITPTYKAYKYVKMLCETLDKNATQPFLHILVDDNSPEIPPVKVTENRKLILLRNDTDPNLHTSQMGQCIDIAFDYANNLQEDKGDRGRRKVEFNNIFYIESDVMPHKNFDIDLIEIARNLGDDWATLDTHSVDEKGNTTYPATIAHRIRAIDEEGGLDILPHADFQCMLINKKILKLFRFNDFPSHWDMLISRKLEEKWKFYRTRKINSVHYAGASREELPK